MFKGAENNNIIIITKSKTRHKMYKDEMQLASFIELIHSSVHCYILYISYYII